MKYKTAFRLALRAIGVLVFAQAFPYLVPRALVLCAELFLGIGGYGGTFGWEFAYVGSALVGSILGLYLFFGGEWIVNRAIPSNRPYCHECGYELTGAPVEGLCPECGTAFRRA